MLDQLHVLIMTIENFMKLLTELVAFTKQLDIRNIWIILTAVFSSKAKQTKSLCLVKNRDCFVILFAMTFGNNYSEVSNNIYYKDSDGLFL